MAWWIWLIIGVFVVDVLILYSCFVMAGRADEEMGYK